MLKNNFISFLFLLVICFFLSSCDPDEETCSLNIEFKHLIDDEEIVYGNENFIYDNNTANTYSVRRLLYILSDITLLFDSKAINLSVKHGILAEKEKFFNFSLTSYLQI